MGWGKISYRSQDRSQCDGALYRSHRTEKCLRFYGINVTGPVFSHKKRKIVPWAGDQGPFKAQKLDPGFPPYFWWGCLSGPLGRRGEAMQQYLIREIVDEGTATEWSEDRDIDIAELRRIAVDRGVEPDNTASPLELLRRILNAIGESELARIL